MRRVPPRLLDTLNKVHSLSFVPVPYRLRPLATAFGVDLCTLARCLIMAGWTYDQFRVLRTGGVRQHEAWWLPPGCNPKPRRSRGRPSYSQLIFDNI